MGHMHQDNHHYISIIVHHNVIPCVEDAVGSQDTSSTAIAGSGQNLSVTRASEVVLVIPMIFKSDHLLVTLTAILE